MLICFRSSPKAGECHNPWFSGYGIIRLKEGQSEQIAGSECTELGYNVFAEDSSAQVELYAKGPCNDSGISKLVINIDFLDCTCPLGFHSSQSSIECSSECDSELQATECFPEEGTFTSNNMLWIGAGNYTSCNDSGYLVHDRLFDYCIKTNPSMSAWVTLMRLIESVPTTEVVSCVKNVAMDSVLCLVPPAMCKQCSNIFLWLLILFAAAGIVLVVFILWLNVVATGTHVWMYPVC